tara:strand:- start:1330 stop:1818 length:489 start_codon:yes stop_codon:yes gene_type:complete
MLLILLLILILIGTGVGAAWYAGKLPGTKKFENNKYVSETVVPLLNTIAISDNKPSIEDLMKVSLVCDGLKERDISPSNIPSPNRRILEICTLSGNVVTEAQEFYRDFAVLKEKDPTFENPNEDSQMCIRLEEIEKNRIAGEVSERDTYKDDLLLLSQSCEN